MKDPEKLNKRKAKRALRRKKIAETQAKMYKSRTAATNLANRVEREKAAMRTNRAQRAFENAASDNTRPPKADQIKNDIARTATYTERMDTGPTPQGGNKKAMRQSMRNVRRRKSQMSKPAYKSNKSLYK